MILLLAYKKRTQRKRRKMWIQPIFKRRREQGEYHNLLQEMRLDDPESHFRYMRMTKERFDSLLSMVSWLLHNYSLVVTCISCRLVHIFPAERLTLTIHFLATVNFQVCHQMYLHVNIKFCLYVSASGVPFI